MKAFRTKAAKGSELNAKLLGLMSQVASAQPSTPERERERELY